MAQLPAWEDMRAQTIISMVGERSRIVLCDGPPPRPLGAPRLIRDLQQLLQGVPMLWLEDTVCGRRG